MDSVDVCSLNHVFTTKVFDSLLSTGFSSVLNAAVETCMPMALSESMTYQDVFSGLYNFLAEHNRNEYFYQNTLFEKILVKKHSLRTTVAFRQLRVGESIADFVMINGKGKAYEIKSDLDNFDRLKTQVSDYFKAFSYVTVVVPERHFQKAINALAKFGEFGSAAGIYALTPRQAISARHIREPKEYDALLSHRHLFAMLRKPEYERLTYQVFKTLPDVQPVFMYEACRDWFEHLPIQDAQKLVMQTLKLRRPKERRQPDHMPLGLESMVYFANGRYTGNQLHTLLDTTYQRG